MIVKKIFHIYVVDDEDSVRKAIKRLLISSGYIVEVFNSARSFLDSIPIDSEGVIILDVYMPDMDGFMLQERLNTLRTKFDVIFMSGFVKAGDREYALSHGAKGFLQKPFNDQSLLNLIKVVIEGHENNGN